MPRGRHNKKNAIKGFRGLFILLLSMTAALILGFFLSPMVIQLIDKDYSNPILVDFSQTMQSTTDHFKQSFSFLADRLLVISGADSKEAQGASEPLTSAEETKTEPKESVPAAEEKPQPEVQNPSESYLLQFAAFEVKCIRVATIASQDRAMTEVETLTEKGFSARAAASGEYVAVQVGAVLDDAEAERLLLQLQANGYQDAYILKWQIKAESGKRVFADQPEYQIGKAVEELDADLAEMMSAAVPPNIESIRQRVQTLQNTQLQFSRQEQLTLWQESLKKMQAYLLNESTEKSNQRLQLIEAVLTMRGWFS